MIAFVRGVTASSMSETSMLYVSGCASTRTGLAPVADMAKAVAMKVFAAVITSSPLPIPMARKVSSSAEMPESTPMAYLAAAERGEFCLESGNVLAQDEVGVAQHALHRVIDLVRDGSVLGLQIDKGHIGSLLAGIHVILLC